MKIFACFLICSVFCAASSDNMKDRWDAWKKKYLKSYTPDEEKRRYDVYCQNVKMIDDHNKQYNSGKMPYQLGENEFCDMSHEEFVASRHGLQRNYADSQYKGAPYSAPAKSTLPEAVNWLKRGCVTHVKDQRNCGSCWAFSASGALEGQHCRKTGKLISLSDQNLVDCSDKFGNKGCQGGLPRQAFEYIVKNNGIDTEQSYPYEAQKRRCRYTERSKGSTQSNFVSLPRGSERKLQEAVALIGPISVGFNGSPRTFKFYKSGIFHDRSCGSRNLDHAVLVVGYGTSSEGKDYWLIKNSWGTNWGIQGYMLLARNSNNMCGVASDANYPVV